MSRFKEYFAFQKKIFKILFIGLIICMLFRIVFMFRFGNMAILKENTGDFGRLFFTGFRFDMQVLTYIMFPFMAVGLLFLFFKNPRLTRIVNKILLYYVSIVFSILTFGLLVDQQFYVNFKSHFNTVLFDFMNEEPLVLMRTMWEEHPVLLIFFITAVAYYGIYRLTRKVLSVSKPNNKKYPVLVNIFIAIFLFGGYFIMMRGSLGTFPLQLKVMNVSNDEFINQCVPNPIFMLKEAHKEAKFEFASDNVQSICKRYGFNSLDEALSVYFDQPIDSIKQKSLENWIYSTSPSKDIVKYPNVVVVLIESWSNHLINFHSDEINLLGPMKKHLEQDILFRNFQSSSNGTLNSLENLILDTPYHPLFDSKYRFISYPSSIAKTFKNAGYETNFLTGIHLAWRHLSEALPNQGFDNVTGKFGILKYNPEAKSNRTWGVYDNYLMDYVFSTLSKAEKPQFIFALTSTSHPPFELPPDYELPPFNISDEVQSQFSTDKEIAKDYLTAYQYSNSFLGNFMDSIKNSHLSENTIVIFTGDHNVRSILPYNTTELLKYKNSVPLYIYFPENIRKDIVVDTERYGSHSDIMPSIIPIVLPGSPYYALGQNLFDTTKNTDRFYSINPYSILHGDGLTDEQTKRIVNAKYAISMCYFNSIFNAINAEE